MDLYDLKLREPRCTWGGGWGSLVPGPQEDPHQPTRDADGPQANTLPDWARDVHLPADIGEGTLHSPPVDPHEDKAATIFLSESGTPTAYLFRSREEN